MSTRRETLLAQLLGTGGGEVASRLAQLGTVALAGWMLGVEGLGLIGIAWSLTTIAQALIQGGPEMAGIPLLALASGDTDRSQASAPGVIAEVTRLKLYLALAAAPLLVLAGLVLGHGDRAAMLQLVAQICAMIVVTLGYAWALRGLLRAVEQGVIRTLQAVTALALLWPLLMVWPSPLAVPVTEAVAALLALGLARHRLDSLARSAEATRSGVRRLVGPALRLGLAGLLSTFGWLVPILAAARWAPIEQVSYLTGTMRLILGILGVIQIALQALYPALAHIHAQYPGRGRAATLSLVLFAPAVTMIGLIPLMIGAEWLVPALLGPEFVAAGPLFQALLPVLIPVALSSPVSYALMARGETSTVLSLHVLTTTTTTIGCVLAFWIAPSAWSVLVLHPLIWGQAVVTLVAGWRCGAIGRPFGGWRVLADFGLFARLIRGDR